LNEQTDIDVETNTFLKTKTIIRLRYKYINKQNEQKKR